MGVGLDVGQQLVQRLGLGGAVLFGHILERHDDIGIANGRKGRRLGEVREGAPGALPAKAAKARAKRAGAAASCLAALHVEYLVAR